MGKSPDAFRTISEVADVLDVPQHVLRFWESKFNQIRPMKRGGGRRYYRPEDVDLLRGIRSLLYTEGYTIRGVQKVLKDQGVKYVSEMGRNGTVIVDPVEEETVAGLAEATQNDNQPSDDTGSANVAEAALSPAATAGETADLFAQQKDLTSGQSAALRNVLGELKSLRDMLDEALDNAET